MEKTAFFRKGPEGHLIFGLRGPQGEEQFDTCIDMIEVLCNAQVEIKLDVEDKG